MQWSSDSIAQLAGALAKAQIELVNPEKALTATIHPDAPGQEARSFNYASLADGLDIVRKTLGRHEIATVQTTAIDQTAGIVNLTTVLAHSSGEWIAPEWQVCAVTDTAVPHRMGAALTYARRYALFTLVGIAGEDDLDAPDLQATPQNAPGIQAPDNPQASGNGHLNGGHPGSLQQSHRGSGRAQSKWRRNGRAAPAKPPLLNADASAELRERLMAELSGLSCADDAALWARRCLPDKNKLSQADAQKLEAAFEARLSNLTTEGIANIEGPERTGSDEPADCSEDQRNFPHSSAALGQAPQTSNQQVERVPAAVPAQPAPSLTASGAASSPQKTKRAARRRRSVTPEQQRSMRLGARAQRLANTRIAPARRRSSGIDKSALSLPEPRRIRDREHVRYVSQQPCLVCGRIPCDPHHLRFTQNRALSRKVSDEFTVPLCRGHHREVHRCGDEAAWWNKLGIDPAPTARALWLESRPLPFDQKRMRSVAKTPIGKTPKGQSDNSARVSSHRPTRNTERGSTANQSDCETKPIVGEPTP